MGRETRSREMLLPVTLLGSFVTSTTATMDPEQPVTIKSLLSLPKVTIADFVRFVDKEKGKGQSWTRDINSFSGNLFLIVKVRRQI